MTAATPALVCCARAIIIVLLTMYVVEPIDRQLSGALQDLADLFNNNSALFERWKIHKPAKQDLQAFVRNVLVAWILLDPPPLDYTSAASHPKRPPVDCMQPRFSRVFTGQKSNSTKYIVDFVPFGYDVDLLEIRFHATYDVVDAFVIYESTRTQSAWQKPLLFNMTKGRFGQFMDKVIYLYAEDSELVGYIDETLRGLSGGGRNKKKGKGDSWALEKAMRTEMISRFIALNATENALKMKIMSNMNMAFGIQNDADEIISGDTLHHFKHCEVKAELAAREIYTPAVVYKRNFYWVEQTSDMRCLESANKNLTDANRFLWRPGPYIWPLEKMLLGNSTLRYHYRQQAKLEVHDAYIGAAMHLSSNGNPALLLLKRFGVVEQHHKGILSHKLIQAARNRTVSPELLHSEIVLSPLCNPSIVHTSKLPDLVVDTLTSLGIPEVVKSNTQRYPFLFPAIVTSRSESGTTITRTANDADSLLWKSGIAVEMKKLCPYK